MKSKIVTILQSWVCKRIFKLFLGRGLCEPIAKEAALKIKEVTYTHVEGYSSGEFKHGPLALIAEGKSCGIMFIPDDENFEFNLITLDQLKKKGAFSVVITNCKHKLADNLADRFIEIPSCGLLTPVLGIIPIQLLSLYLGELKGNEIDQPRHLTKVVTI